MCNFCEEITDFDIVKNELREEDGDCGRLCKSPTGDIWFCMRIYDVIKVCVFDFCPMCGRKLTEEEDV